MEFLARFDFDIVYIKGETNLVADALSRYYESDLWNKQQDVAQYVNVDAWLDPKGEDLPWERFEENHTMSMLDNDSNTTSHPKQQRRAPI